MEEEKKQDYREHLINTIDSLIDGGVSVYNINVINKKAIRYNYIPKQKVIEEIDKVLEAFRKVEFNRVTSWNSLVQLKENLLGDK